MARAASTRRELPPPLPPESRTVGQLVGEAIRIYGRNVWRALAIGLPIALVNALVWAAPDSNQVFVAAVGALLATVSYLVACSIVTEQSLRSQARHRGLLRRRARLRPLSTARDALHRSRPLWLSLFGLAVPVALVEGLGIRAVADPRGAARSGGLRPRPGRVGHARDLGRFLTQASLFFVLREFAENTRVAAATLASIVVSPLVLLGAALLYVDQDSSIRLTPRATKGARCRRT